MKETFDCTVLFKKLAAISGRLEKVSKTGKNKSQNYAFATVDDIFDAVRPELANEHIFLFQSMAGMEEKDILTANGKHQTRTSIHFVFTFVCGDTGATWDLDWYAVSNDSEDKGASKAAVYARKYLFRNIFNISTGDVSDDQDADAGTDTSDKHATGQQRQESGDDDTYTVTNVGGLTIRRTKKGEPMYLFPGHPDSGFDTAFAFSRDVLREAGYNVNDWVLGDDQIQLRIELDPPAIVTMSKRTSNAGKQTLYVTHIEQQTQDRPAG